jgi:hypothetical protein
MNNVSLALSVSDQIPVLPGQANAASRHDAPVVAQPDPPAGILMSLGHSVSAQTGTIELVQQELESGEILRRLLSPLLAESRIAEELLTSCWHGLEASALYCQPMPSS